MALTGPLTPGAVAEAAISSVCAALAIVYVRYRRERNSQGA